MYYEIRVYYLHRMNYNMRARDRVADIYSKNSTNIDDEVRTREWRKKKNEKQGMKYNILDLTIIRFGRVFFVISLELLT